MVRLIVRHPIAIRARRQSRWVRCHAILMLTFAGRNSTLPMRLTEFIPRAPVASPPRGSIRVAHCGVYDTHPAGQRSAGPEMAFCFISTRYGDNNTIIQA